MTIFEAAAVLLGVSAIFGLVNHKYLKLPHTIGLVLMALVGSLIIVLIEAVNPSVHLSGTLANWLREIDFHDTLMNAMLSFLLFAGAMHVNFSAFKQKSVAIGIMATSGTLLSTFLVGGVMWWLLNAFGLETPFIWALVFGALISPTDPVAVLGLFKTVKVPETLEAKMAGESLFNDGVGVVVFTVVLAIAAGGSAHGGHGGDMGVGAVVALFMQEAVGGAVLGLLAGYLGYRLLHAIDEHNIEVLITLALVMCVYALALRLHTSGPIAMVVAGLFIGNTGMKHAVSDNSRDYMHKFWSLLDEILNSVLFLLIGMEVLLVAQRADHLEVALLAIPVCLAARFVSVALPLTLLSRWESFSNGAIRILTWGGLRGGIAVALALSLPHNEYKETIVTITYAVVLFSIIVQGLTVQPLVRRLLPED